MDVFPTVSSNSKKGLSIKVDKIFDNHGFDPLIKMIEIYEILSALEGPLPEWQQALVDKQIAMLQYLIPYRYARYRGMTPDRNAGMPMGTIIQNFSSVPIQQIDSPKNASDFDDNS